VTTDDSENFTFTDELLDVLGAWQRGWREDMDLKRPIEEKLIIEAAKLPDRFRAAPDACYRKRFLYKGDMESLIMFGGLDDGVASWTTDRAFAKDFKGIVRPDAVTASFFEHRPHPEEVIVNFPALWADPEFVRAAEDYRMRGGKEAVALFNFAGKQGEVVLHARLHADEIRGMVGDAPDFDAACDQAGIAQEARDALFKKLTEMGVHFGGPIWSSESGAPRVVENARRRFLERNERRIQLAAVLRQMRPLWLGSVSHLAMSRGNARLRALRAILTDSATPIAGCPAPSPTLCRKVEQVRRPRMARHPEIRFIDIQQRFVDRLDFDPMENELVAERVFVDRVGIVPVLLDHERVALGADHSEFDVERRTEADLAEE
jgi:hypothetical protein